MIADETIVTTVLNMPGPHAYSINAGKGEDQHKGELLKLLRCWKCNVLQGYASFKNQLLKEMSTTGMNVRR